MTAPGIVVDSEGLRLLAAQLNAATDEATRASMSVHDGLGLAELAVAAALDPAGALNFEIAAMQVLLGPFGLSRIAADLHDLAGSLAHAAAGYLEADLLAAADLLAGPYVDQLTLLASLIPPDSTPTVTARAMPYSTVPPRTLTDLLTRLDELDRSREPHQGEIDIQTLTGTDAHGRPVRKVIAYLPGVDDWTLDPFTDNVNNGFVAARAIRGESSTYEYGVLDALRAAGVTPDDDVTLVGHSQGGAVAVNTARDAVRAGSFNITHVVTVGAPTGIALAQLPSSVKVLAFENTTDAVPKVDGRANPRRANITTVEYTDANPNPLDNHGLDSYLPAARKFEANNNAAVSSYVASDSRAFTLDQSSTVRYSITGN